MEVRELKHLIQSKDIPNFLIFTGDEYMMQRIYIQQIAKVKKLEIRRVDNVSDIVNTLTAKSLFSQNYLYIVQDDKEFITTEKLYTDIEDKLHDNMLILQLTSFDKRLKMLKTYKSSLIEFETLKSDILKRYIQKEINLSDSNCEILMEICEYNYGRCLLEIDKIKQFRTGYGEKDIFDNDAFSMLLKDGAIHIPPRDNIWSFIRAVLQNKPAQAFELWKELKELKTPVMSILSNLYTEAKHVLQIQTCSSNDVAKSTGLNNWQIKNARECANRFSDDDLMYLMRLVQKVERGIKTGLIEEDIAVEYILTNFL